MFVNCGAHRLGGEDLSTTQAINGELGIGDYIIVAPGDDYRCHVGQVTAIDKLGTEEHSTEKAGDDVHVDFSILDYPPWRRSEIANYFGGLYREDKQFDELPLDDVIMAPDAIISLHGVKNEEIKKLVSDYGVAERYCNEILEKCSVERLVARVEKNLSDYHDSLIGLTKREIIDRAGEIAAMSDAHYYLTECHAFEPEEVEYLLKFDFPLEVVADAWSLYQNLFEMDSVLDEVVVQQDALNSGYLLVSDAKEADDGGPYRFMNVDLIDFLGKIAQKVIVYYPNDWNIDMDTLHRAALSGDADDKRLMWHVCSYGTHLNTERGTYVKDTGAYNTWVDYRPNDPDMFGYASEITETDGLIVKGNVFEVGDYAEHARYVRKTALPLDSVTLTYSDAWGVNAGKSITVPRSEYDSDRYRLMSESGNVTHVRYHPAESVMEMTTLLQRERSQRMAYPIGSPQAYLHELDERLAELRGISEQRIDSPKPKQKRRVATIEEKLRAAQEKVNAQPTNTAPKQHNKNTEIQ